MTPSELAVMVDRLVPQITPGPWEWHNSKNPDNRYFIGEHGHMCIAVEPMGSDYRADDPEAVALVPDLMAENQRLRRELEALRDDLGRAGYFSDPDPDGHSLGEMKEASRIGRTITRILNGENHE